MVNGLPDNGSVSYDPAIGSFSVAFKQIMDPSTINDANNFVLRGAGQDGAFDTAVDVVYPLTYSTYMIGTNQVEISVDNAPLVPDNYRFTILCRRHAGPVRDRFGRRCRWKRKWQLRAHVYG